MNGWFFLRLEQSRFGQIRAAFIGFIADPSFFTSLILLLYYIYVKRGFLLRRSSTLLPRLVALDVSIDWILEAVSFSCSLLCISWLFVHCSLQVKTSLKTRNKKDYGLIAKVSYKMTIKYR
jgi:hypothetical protein